VSEGSSSEEDDVSDEVSSSELVGVKVDVDVVVETDGGGVMVEVLGVVDTDDVVADVVELVVELLSF